MTVLTVRSCSEKKKETPQEGDHGYSSPKKSNDFVVDVKDTETLVDNEMNENDELPLPKTEFKPTKGGKKRVTFDLPVDEEKRWHQIFLKLILALLCTLAVISAGRYAVQRYQLYQWEKQYHSAHVKVMYQIEDQEFASDALMMETGVKNQIQADNIQNFEKAGQRLDRGPEVVDFDPPIDKELSEMRGEMVAGNIEEWISVGPKKWRIDSQSEDGQKNYSILTDAVTNYTALLLSANLQDTPNNPPPLDLRHSVCYVTPSSALNLPHLNDITKFLELVDQEASMFVTKLSRSLYFNIGQPINVDVDKYGSTIHEFCSGNTAFALQPMDVMEFIRQNMKRLVPGEGETSQEIQNKVSEVVEKVAQSSQAGRMTQDVGQGVSGGLFGGKAVSTSTQEATTSQTTTEEDSQGVVEVKDPEEEETGQDEVVEGDGIPDDRWTMTSQGMEAPREIVEGAERIQQLNSQLVQSLHSGNLLHVMELMHQFHRIMAFLPCGNYNLHSPEGMAMNIHIRRQESPVPGFMHSSMQVAGNVGIPGPHLHLHHGHQGPQPQPVPVEIDEKYPEPRFPEVLEVIDDAEGDVSDGVDEAKSHSALPDSFWGDILGI